VPIRLGDEFAGVSHQAVLLAVTNRSPSSDSRDASKGWAFPWYSCYGSGFDHDFHTRLENSSTPTGYSRQPGGGSLPHEGSRMFHTYSMSARRAETLGNWCYWLDLTARGKQQGAPLLESIAPTRVGADMP
jgi:predicted dithiol-disulfide oxidoreductase (DUF899 family)